MTPDQKQTCTVPLELFHPDAARQANPPVRVRATCDPGVGDLWLLAPHVRGLLGLPGTGTSACLRTAENSRVERAPLVTVRWRIARGAPGTSRSGIATAAVWPALARATAPDLVVGRRFIATAFPGPDLVPGHGARA